jgi:hypothetical protein
VRLLRPALLLLSLVGASCRKVPITQVETVFQVADAAWFAEEETLFVFAEVHADQGLGEPSLLEVTWTTDDGEVPWTPLSELTNVHTHLPVDCGPRALCQSASVAVPLEPRNVRVRLRYHRDGELAFEADTAYNVVGRGPAHSNRSFVVYGVFDETNRAIQWRGRHQFPTVRNEKAQALGLRRSFLVEDARYGDGPFVPRDNPYGYGLDCPRGLPETGAEPVGTADRAVFGPDLLPLAASDEATVCARATVTDATGTFVTDALARKNPEVRPGFPALRSPIHDALVLPFFLAPCGREISDDHEEMQRQRLLLGDLPPTCTDDWERPNFVPELAVRFREAVEEARPLGRDMVLVIGLHQDEPGLSEAVEEALVQVAPQERHRTTPRLAGAFVLDSTIRGLSDPELAPVTLWCPSTLPTSAIPDASARSCAIAPDNPDFELGPFSFGALPILPDRTQYLDFLETYSKAQAGTVQSLAFRTPEFAASAAHVDLGEFGVATFLNGEQIDADSDDAFSWCVPDEPLPFVFSSELLGASAAYGIGAEQCEYLGLPPGACESATVGLLPIDALPEWHNAARESVYDLGIFWEFPFLLRMEYEVVGAGAVSAFGFSVPFGLASDAESYYGAPIWSAEVLPLGDELTQCKRFCDHPTFDSAGVYHPTQLFRPTYQRSCYLPDLPEPGDGGYPSDP